MCGGVRRIGFEGMKGRVGLDISITHLDIIVFVGVSVLAVRIKEMIESVCRRLLGCA